MLPDDFVMRDYFQKHNTTIKAKQTADPIQQVSLAKQTESYYKDSHHHKAFITAIVISIPVIKQTIV